MDRFVKAEGDFEWARHPIFGEMGEKEWLRWGPATVWFVI